MEAWLKGTGPLLASTDRSATTSDLPAPTASRLPAVPPVGCVPPLGAVPAAGGLLDILLCVCLRPHESAGPVELARAGVQAIMAPPTRTGQVRPVVLPGVCHFVSDDPCLTALPNHDQTIRGLAFDRHQTDIANARADPHPAIIRRRPGNQQHGRSANLSNLLASPTFSSLFSTGLLTGSHRSGSLPD
jgi:hypothetical protein